MASHVTVIASDLRRTTVKVTPGTYLTDVLQEACKKLGVSSNKYLLKHKQKQLDLSVVWRQSGLSPGAKLELVQKSKTPSAVSVALQLPDSESNASPNGRLVEKFASDLTIWKMLRHFESVVSVQGKNLNLTARGVAQTERGAQTGSGQLYYETPVLNIMGRELASFPDFQKTLSQLGYNSGSVLMRLSFRRTDQTLFAAMAEISHFFEQAEAEEKEAQTEAEGLAPAPTYNEPASTHAAVEDTDSMQPTSQQAEVTTQQANSDLNESSTGGAQNGLSPQTHVAPKELSAGSTSNAPPPVTIFRAPAGNTPAAAQAPISESDYVPSVAHAQLHQARLQHNSTNKRLLSDRELEEQVQAAEAKLAAVASVPIKVRFPDNTSAQWSFGPNATGAVLYGGVRSVMSHAGQKFRLVLPGAEHTVVRDSDAANNRLIHDYKLTRSTLVNLVYDDSVPAEVRRQPFLKGSAAEKAMAVQVPELPKGESEGDAGKVAGQPTKPQGDEKGDGGGGKKLPKWLKLPGKK